MHRRELGSGHGNPAYLYWSADENLDEKTEKDRVSGEGGGDHTRPLVTRKALTAATGRKLQG